MERRRIRSDLPEVFYWYRGINKGNINSVLQVNNKDRTHTNRFQSDKSGLKELVRKTLNCGEGSTRMEKSWQLTRLKTILYNSF